MKQTFRMIATAVMFAIAGASSSQSYPVKPITVVFGFPPGTSLDSIARPVTDEMAKRLGQRFIFEFKPGASATIAAKYVVNAKPDGYTLLYCNCLPSHPVFVRNNSVDPVKELASVSLFASGPYVLFSRGNLPAASMQELLAYAKANPGKLRYGSANPAIDIAFSMLKSRNGFVAEGIPYKSGPQIIAAMLAGEIDLTFAPVFGFMPHIQSGKLRAVFFAAPSRYAGLPDVPTSAEAGVADFDVGGLQGLWTPLGTPKDIVHKLAAEAALAVKNPGISELIRKSFDFVPVGSTPEEQLRMFEASVKLWSEGARAANFQPQ